MYALHLVVHWLGNSPPVAIGNYLQVRDEGYKRAASEQSAKAVQNPVQPGAVSWGTTSHDVAARNEKPLVLRENPTKQGVFKTQLVPPAGFEPAYQD